jgi:DNA replication protein DnaC
MNKEIHSKIQRDYDKKRRRNMDELQSRKMEVFQKVPDIQKNEELVASIGLAYSKGILLGKTSTDSLNELTQKIQRYQEEKRSLLESNGFHGDYLELRYDCAFCKDTGFVEAEISVGFLKCSCYKQQLIHFIYEKSNLANLETKNFRFFEINRYTDQLDEKKYGITISPRQNMSKIVDKAKEFIENFTNYEYKGLLFVGRTGTGKTFLSNCIAKDLMDRGKTVLYLSSPQLFHMLKNYRTSSWENQKQEDEAYNYIMEAELLVIDDLGIENVTTARYSEFLTILNTRASNDARRPCKTIISSNLGYKELLDLYTERVLSRIIGDFLSLKFVGEDLRVAPKK